MNDVPAAISIRPTLLRRSLVWFKAHLAQILALAVLVDAFLIGYPMAVRVLNGEHLSWLAEESWRDLIIAVGLLDLPSVALSLGLLLMSFGLWQRARVAWAFTLILLIPATIIAAVQAEGMIEPPIFYNVVLILALIHYWTIFHHSSLAAGTLFALASFVSLIWYAMLGSLYLGKDFTPPIEDVSTAAYFSVVAMSTVGFGDIVPTTHTARLFVISVIVVGITVFATALGAVITPLVGGKLRELIQRKARHSMRKNHVILCGSTPLATNLYKSLTAKGEAITVILKSNMDHEYPPNTDIIWGDASGTETLLEAGITDAKVVLALRDDDSENAFIVLAVKSFTDCSVKTVVAVNASQNLEKMRRVNADLVFSPQLLGAELLSRTLLGEKIDSSIFFEMSFAKSVPVEPVASPDEPVVDQTPESTPPTNANTDTTTTKTTTS
jgi:voltage-gated potassium channel